MSTRSKRQRIIKVLVNTRLKDLRVGDTVITGELMRVAKITRPYRKWAAELDVIDLKPQCGVCGKKRCAHIHSVAVGWGQQSVQKVIK